KFLRNIAKDTRSEMVISLEDVGGDEVDWKQFAEVLPTCRMQFSKIDLVGEYDMQTVLAVVSGMLNRPRTRFCRILVSKYDHDNYNYDTLLASARKLVADYKSVHPLERSFHTIYLNAVSLMN